jgi:hypothetical protein
MTLTPRSRAGETGHPLASSAPEPSPEAASLTVPDAACGRAVPTPAARTVPAAVSGGGQGNPSRREVREGIAGPVVGTIGPAQSSPSEPVPLGFGGARGTESPPPAPSRPAPVVRPPGGRGPHTSTSVAEGRAGGDEGDGPPLRRRTPGVGSSPTPIPAGGRRSSAMPPAAGPLSGEDFRKAWKAAESAKNAAARRRRGHRTSTPASPGVGRLRVAAPRSEVFDAPPPPTIVLRTPPEPPEAAL